MLQQRPSAELPQTDHDSWQRSALELCVSFTAAALGTELNRNSVPSSLLLLNLFPIQSVSYISVDVFLVEAVSLDICI